LMENRRVHNTEPCHHNRNAGGNPELAQCGPAISLTNIVRRKHDPNTPRLERLAKILCGSPYNSPEKAIFFVFHYVSNNVLAFSSERSANICLLAHIWV